jgi:hypothetical protein
VRVIKSRKMSWAGPVAHLWERGGVYRVFGGGNLRERDHWGDPGVRTGIKKDKSCTGLVCGDGFKHVTARSRLAYVLKLMRVLYK